MQLSKNSKLAVCCLLAVVLALSIVLPFTGINANTIVADAATDNTYSGNYYNKLDTSLRGDQFRNQLVELITTTHKTQTVYNGSSNLALNNVFNKTDKNPNGSGMVLFYTGTVVSSFDAYGANREHVWPKDGGNAFPEKSQAGSDAHHLRPCDQNLNSTRGSLSFGETTEKIAKQNTSTSYGNLCYTGGGFFYPGKGYRGATARILMYVQTRWGNSYSLKFQDGSGKCKTIGDFKTLMKWHLEEPPTESEYIRNQAVYEIQGNRNPFIDHPEYAEYIYSENGSYYAKDGAKMASEVNALLANNNPYGDGTNVEPTDLTLDNYFKTVEIGNSFKLTLGTVPANASKSVTWTSKTPSVATVSSDGTVTAVSAGTATIVATSKLNASAHAECVVTVVKPRTAEIVEVSGTPTKKVYNQGDKFDPTGLTVTVMYDNDDVEQVALADCEWLDGTTLAKTLSYGTTTVKCKYGNVVSDDIVTGITVNKVISTKKTISLLVDNFGKATSYAWQDWSSGGIAGKAYVYTNQKKIQFNGKKVSSYMFNTTAMTGGIKSVTLKGEGEWQLLTNNKAYAEGDGTASGGTDNGTKSVTAAGVTWTLSGNNEYFALNLVENAVSILTEITITYGNDGTTETECNHVAGEWETTLQPTCTEKGKKEQHCTLCNELLKAEFIDATGHKYGEWHVDAEPTETIDGSKSRVCEKCNDKQTEVIPATGGGIDPDPDPKPDPNPNPDPDPKPNPDKPLAPGADVAISCNSVVSAGAVVLLAVAVLPVTFAVRRKRDE